MNGVLPDLLSDKVGLGRHLRPPCVVEETSPLDATRQKQTLVRELGFC